jgi:hypothetical protein
MMGPQLEPAVDNFDDVQMNQVSVPTMAYVAALEKRISVIKTQMRISNQNLQGRIKNLEHMVLDLTKTSVSSLQTLSVDQPSQIDPLIGFSTWSVSTGWGQARNRTSRTHEDMLTRCESNQSNGMPNAGLLNCGKICYSNAIFQALASCNHHTTLFNDPPQQNHERFALYYAFSELLHSMAMHQRSQQDVVDPSNLIKLFLECHSDFVDVESEYC